METSHNRPEDRVRQRFVLLLQAAKALPVIQNPEGPNKGLAAQLRVSPSQIAKFLKPKSVLWDGPTLKGQEAKVRKAVRGFSASVERARLWLEQNPIPGQDIKGLETAAIVQAYWPSKFAAQFPLFLSAVQDGIDAAGKTAAGKINIELWIPNWGPLAEGEKDARTAFYSEYGNAIVRGIDPLANITAKQKSLADILDLPVRTLHAPWVVALGMYRALHRRFQGMDFISFPLEFPLMGLIASVEASNDEGLEFHSLLDRNFHLKRIVVDHDVGDYVLHSMYRDTPRQGTVQRLETKRLEQVPQLILTEVRRGAPVVF